MPASVITFLELTAAGKLTSLPMPRDPPRSLRLWRLEQPGRALAWTVGTGGGGQQGSSVFPRHRTAEGDHSFRRGHSASPL